MKTCYAKKLSSTKIAIADLSESEYGHMVINRINVPRDFRGLGHATALLQQIIIDAAREGVTLWLEISPSDGLGREALQAWYERYGFIEDQPGVWKREPSWTVTND